MYSENELEGRTGDEIPFLVVVVDCVVVRLERGMEAGGARDEGGASPVGEEAAVAVEGSADSGGEGPSDAESAGLLDGGAILVRGGAALGGAGGALDGAGGVSRLASGTMVEGEGGESLLEVGGGGGGGTGVLVGAASVGFAVVFTGGASAVDGVTTPSAVGRRRVTTVAAGTAVTCVVEPRVEVPGLAVLPTIGSHALAPMGWPSCSMTVGSVFR